MPTHKKSEKTVYVLGAGFSSPAGGPNQAYLLKEIFALPNSPETPKIRTCKKALKEFLLDVLHVAPERVTEASLEDIYTPIDRCLADGISLRNMPATKLRIFRGQMEYLISLAIDKSFNSKSIGAKRYVRNFATYLVKQASLRATKAEGSDNGNAARAYDPFSIISLNWDVLLDSYLFDELRRHDMQNRGHMQSGREYEPIGVVDYCCHYSSVDPRERRIRAGLWALGARGYTVKLLKIHGSMNWLQCSNCQRLYVAFGQKINIPNYIDAQSCRHCLEYGVDAKLHGALVMPTFLKDLTNFQIKLVWQNAGVELMEADKLVFIGYSLPHADFEFRQLLSRMVHKDASVHVVLYNSGTPDGIRRYDEECTRYRQFFGGRQLTFESNGVEAFVTSVIAASEKRSLQA